MKTPELINNYTWEQAFVVSRAEWCVSDEDYGKSLPKNVRVEDVEKVFLTSVVHTGDYAEEDVIGVFKLKDGRYAVLKASCDTTGWDCQAGGTITCSYNPSSIIQFALTDQDKEDLNVDNLQLIVLLSEEL